MSEPTPPAPPAGFPWRRSRRFWLLLAAVPVVAAVAAAALFNHGGKLSHLTAKVTRGGIRDVVEATCTVITALTVPVASTTSRIPPRVTFAVRWLSFPP